MKPPRLPHVPLPAASARKEARVVALAPEEIADVASAARALPDPSDLPEGTLVMVDGRLREARSIARSVLAALGRTKSASRAIRCSALVARGYVRVGAATDPDERTDWAWGYATGPCSD